MYRFPRELHAKANNIEKYTRKDSVMHKKSIDCIVQHIKAFHDQSSKGLMADFGEPCQNCIYGKKCDYDWLSIMEPLIKQSHVQISMVHSAGSER